MIKVIFLNINLRRRGHQGTIKIALKYDRVTKRPVIQKLARISRPGLRKYAKVERNSKNY